MKRVLLLAALLLACVAPNLRAEEKCAICGKPAAICIGVAGPHVPWCVEHIGVMPARGGFVVGPPLPAPAPGETALPSLRWSFPTGPVSTAPLAPANGAPPAALGGYVNPDEEYVAGHYQGGHWIAGYFRTRANKTTGDNFSHRGNVNPHTGRRGTRP